MKNNKMLIITSALCLLPIIMSCAVYSQLPGQVAVHWNVAGNPDNFLPKAVAAFGLPVLFTAINIFSNIKLSNDPSAVNGSNAIRKLMTWLIPLISLIIMPITLCNAMGMSIPITIIAQVFLGILLVVIGNYMPKTRRNYIIGIKLPWTLHDDDNWNKTHRVCGYLYVISGILFIALTFIFFESSFWGIITMPVIALLVVFPILYSFLLYKNLN